MPLRRAATSTSLLALVLGAAGLAATGPAHAVADRDCVDFTSQRAAQIFFLEQGGPRYDPHRLDADGDKVVCETLPGPYYYGTTVPSSTTTTTTTTTTTVTLRQRARVVKVVDGDTLRVRLVGGRTKDVRMIGIDTPEVYGGVECGGRQASASMRKLTPVGTRVVLVSDPTQDRVDRYGRILRYVIKAGKDMNRAQVQRGWARVYVYDNTPFRRTAAYRKSQRSAKAADRGVWGTCS